MDSQVRTQCIQTPHRKTLLALAGFILHQCASTRRFAATFLQAGKYRGKPLALCRTLVSRTCSLEAAHSFLSMQFWTFARPCTEYTALRVCIRRTAWPRVHALRRPQFLTSSSVCLFFVHYVFSCTSARPCTIDLYTILHATLHCACAILRGHARPASCFWGSPFVCFFIRGHDLENNLTLHTFFLPRVIVITTLSWHCSTLAACSCIASCWINT